MSVSVVLRPAERATAVEGEPEVRAVEELVAVMSVSEPAVAKVAKTEAEEKLESTAAYQTRELMRVADTLLLPPSAEDCTSTEVTSRDARWMRSKYASVVDVLIHREFAPTGSVKVGRAVLLLAGSVCTVPLPSCTEMIAAAESAVALTLRLRMMNGTSTE